MDTAFAANILNNMIALIVSLSFHEAAHAYVAKLQGDNTAALDGRLTLNPIPHMDPIGTIVFPLIGNILGGFAIFGWAKPVPVDLRNLKDPKWSHVLVAAAGPAANLLLCLLSLFFLQILQMKLGSSISEGSAAIAFHRLAISLIQINALLAFFNLIPLKPLDGGTIFTAFLPQNLEEKYTEYIEPYGMFILLALLITGGLNWIGHLAFGYIGLARSVVFAVL